MTTSEKIHTKILWADDQVDVAKSFSPMLFNQAVQIDFAPDGESALEKICTESYDLVLLDLAMPPDRWGGLWLLEEIRRREIKIKVIVVSGEGAQPETIKALRLGAIDYVTKEQLAIELPAQIKRALEQREEKSKIEKTIATGECDIVEFKSTLRTNLFTKKTDPEMELSVLKSIAAFANSEGGTLLVGVKDDGHVLGIEGDSFPNVDKFQLHFWNLFRGAIGAEFSHLFKSSLHLVEGKQVFCVLCGKSTRPVYVRWKKHGEAIQQELFFVRAGPQTESLGTQKAVAYITEHFK